MKKIIFIILVVIVVLIGVGLFKEDFLVMKEANSGKIIWQKSNVEDLEFAIEYMHSVEKTPVWDYFKVENGKILLTGTRYESYGAGLPYLQEYDYIVENEEFIINGIDKVLDNIPVRVSDFAKHKFLVEDKEYKLYEMTRPQNLLIIEVENVSELAMLTRRIKQWLRN
ncbi:DUF1850 domain-containing protein [Orenia marismortui]|uniref:DUF1850 domain-containing protein n=1 Tax=Orenia marismortui TaxID=46469 RepID=UPI0010659096|nr:DUF1850 domain-containing protein [Orenia marismortui]